MPLFALHRCDPQELISIRPCEVNDLNTYIRACVVLNVQSIGGELNTSTPRPWQHVKSPWHDAHACGLPERSILVQPWELLLLESCPQPSVLDWLIALRYAE